MIKIIQWLRPSFEGNDNKASGRRLTAFTVMLVYIAEHFWILFKISEPFYYIQVLALDMLFVCILFGIVTAQQIIQLKQGLPSPPEETVN